MDYLKILFQHKETIKQDKFSPNFQTPMIVIEEQLKILEYINLSPIPQTLQEEDIYYKDIKQSIMKIIFFINIVLTEKLKQNEIKQSNNNSKSEHYWKIITKHFSNLDTVKFINNNLTDINDSHEKALIFLTLIIIDKLIYRFLKQFYSENFEK